MNREEVTALLEQADNLRDGKESTLTIRDIELLERHDKDCLEMNTSFLDVGIQPYINIADRANELRFLLANPPPRLVKEGMYWKKAWGSRGEWFWEEVKYG